MPKRNPPRAPIAHRWVTAAVAAAAVCGGLSATPAHGQMSTEEANKRLLARAAAHRAAEVEKRRPLLNELKAKAAAGDAGAVWTFAVQKQLVSVVKGQVQIEPDAEWSDVKRSYLAWVDGRAGGTARREGLSAAAAAMGADTVAVVFGPDAVSRFTAAATAGHHPSQLYLAQMYLRGWGVTQDDGRGRQLLTAAATGGYPPAANVLARAYLNGWNGLAKDPAAAVAWATRAARAGDVPSRTLLGIMYSDGTDLPRDMDRAMDWFYKAATAGDADAAGLLAFTLATGDHWPADPAEGFQWATAGATAGDARCAFLLGLMYEDGSGTRRSLASAQRWYQTAADAGNADARLAVARVGRQRQAIADRRAQADADRQRQMAADQAGVGPRRDLDMGRPGPRSPWPNYNGPWQVCPVCGGTGIDAAAQRTNTTMAGVIASSAPPMGITVARNALVYCSTCGGTGRIPLQ